MTPLNNHRFYSVQIDLVGFADNPFLDGWKMSNTKMKKLNTAFRHHSFLGISSVSGSISNEDDNTAGDNKVYIAVETVVYAESERKAAELVLDNVVEPLVAALPARGNFEIDGDADCMTSDLASQQEMDTVLLNVPVKVQKSVRSFRRMY